MTADIETVSSRQVYENAWLRVREDVVRRRDQSIGLYGVVERRDFVIVAPLQDGRLTLVEQYRYPIRARIWELPMGMWPDDSEIAAETLAEAELREETGYRARELTPIGTVLMGPGFCDQRGHVFVATGLVAGAPAREATEQDMRCQDFTLDEVARMVGDGTLQDGMTLAALGLLRLRGMI